MMQSRRNFGKILPAAVHGYDNLKGPEQFTAPERFAYECNARAKGDAVAEVARCFDYVKKCPA